MIAEKQNIRTWRIRFALFILAGLAIGVILVANRSRMIKSPPTSVRQEVEFPIGLYCVNTRFPTSNEVVKEFPEIAKVGFNFIQSYQFEYDSTLPGSTDADAKKFLDVAQQNGLKVLLGLYVGLSDETIKQDIIHINERVTAFKDHPALFGWQLYDEPSTTDPPVPPRHLERAYGAVKAIDTVHPVTIAEAITVDENHLYAAGGGFDIVMPDGVSAIPLQELHVSRRQDLARSVRFLAQRGRSIINHLQVYNLAKDRLTCPPDQSAQWPECAINRYPTKDEIRFMAYDSIVLGAKGLSFLCYRFNYDEDDPGDDVSPSANPAQWANIAAVSRELKDMSSILSASDSSISVTINPSSAVALSAKDYKGRLYLIATNPSPTAKTATFSLPKAPAIVTVLSESRSLTPKGNSFQDTFAAYDVHVYYIYFAP